MAKELLPEALWREVEPLLPPHPGHPRGGAAFADDRRCLRGILFVLRTGLAWQDLPADAFGVSGSTCWRRMRDWTAAGVWPRLHRRLLDRLGRQGAVDHSAAAIDSASVRALKGGRTRARTRRTGPNAAANATWSPTPAACRCS